MTILKAESYDVRELAIVDVRQLTAAKHGQAAIGLDAGIGVERHRLDVSAR